MYRYTTWCAVRPDRVLQTSAMVCACARGRDGDDAGAAPCCAALLLVERATDVIYLYSTSMYVLPLVLVLFIRASICMASVAARMSAVEAWCPRYHQVGGGRDGHEPDIYDPSGPIKVGATWYVFADGGSTHWESADLLRWKKVTPGWFSGLTGSITLTPSGYHAIYVGKAGTGGSGMVRRTAVGNNLSEWSAAELINHSGVAGGMDPAEAFLLNGSWRLPVLAGGGRLSLMRATDDTLGSFDSAMLVLNVRRV